jgi:hypothetical protein
MMDRSSIVNSRQPDFPITPDQLSEPDHALELAGSLAQTSDLPERKIP